MLILRNAHFTSHVTLDVRPLFLGRIWCPCHQSSEYVKNCQRIKKDMGVLDETII
jgi:hypothetical protein